jgi:hypothetical protein
MKKILFTIIFVLGFYNCSKEESGTASSTDTEKPLIQKQRQKPKQHLRLFNIH